MCVFLENAKIMSGVFPIIFFLHQVVHSFDISYDSDDEKKSEKENEETYTTPAGATLTKTQAIPIINL